VAGFSKTAIAHTAPIFMQALFHVFGDRFISSGIWSARSRDFFFWGCLKDKVYNIIPRTEEDPKENVCKEVANIPAKQLRRVN
jgi:hypothetical protein